MITWTSIDKELPQVGQDILVYDTYGGVEIVTVARCVKNSCNCMIFKTQLGALNEYVTHWSPLNDPDGGAR